MGKRLDTGETCATVMNMKNTTKNTNPQEAPKMYTPTTPFTNHLGLPVWPARMISTMTTAEVTQITDEVKARFVEAEANAPKNFNPNMAGPIARKAQAQLAVATKALEAIYAHQA
tara:strand:+ start:9804 stop:10148 length:345 start_codon:yes stop_codon:yes gene_type:complete